MPTGRFAPSPTGRLHLGNLRTAMAAWLFARSSGSRFLLRLEDLDPATSRDEHVQSQPADLAALGVDWDGPIVLQSTRRDRHDAAIERLVAAGLTYPCYCTRREIQEAASAPHGAPPGAYPGTCRDLTPAQRAEREADGRRPALRLRSDERDPAVDDLVLRRGDGIAAYNLAVVVDDAEQGVEQVVRADDLLPSTPRQIHLAELLEYPVPSYVHVPLVLAPSGERLAKRHGAVTLEDLQPDDVRSRLAVSLGLAQPGERVTMAMLLDRFDPAALPTEPWIFSE